MRKNKLLITKSGFTMFEIIVSISLFAVIIILTSSIYGISQKSYNKQAAKGELVQNARVSLDRMSREIRQSVDIVTVLPETDDDPEDPPVEEIFFQDGHNINQVSYIKYYLDETDLYRSIIVYYFNEEQDIYVIYNSVDQSGDPPEELILENKIVGEYFNLLNFWGSGGLVYISLGFNKGDDIFNINTSVFSRN